MTSYTIGVIPGDGIGPEVIREALKVLHAVSDLEGFRYQLVEYPYSGAHYLATKELVPDAVVDEWRTLDAVLLGAIGHPAVEPGLVERSVILGLRFGLDLYVNLRPIKLYAERLCPLKGKGPEDIDFVVVRENTEGMYSQIGGHLRKNTPDEVAIVNGVYTWKGCERASRYAFDLARRRGATRSGSRKPKVTLVDKANAIRPHDVWTRAFAHVARDFPDVETDHAYVDACCMWMIKNPEWFDVIVTTNLFGDIITDLGAMLQGGMGVAASGNIHPGKTSMFEPIHGSAPKYAGKNVACPLGAILAAAMMLDVLGETRAAPRIEGAVAELLRSGAIPAADARSGIATDAMGDMVVERVMKAEGVGRTNLHHPAPHRAQVWARPPSIATVAPVIQAAWGEARKTISSATSSGSPTRPRGWVVALRSRNARYASSPMPPRRWSSVRTTPGFTAFTRTPSGASSSARQRVSWSTAALLTQ
jgi:3-isopropylmalate dehydrogenase